MTDYTTVSIPMNSATALRRHRGDELHVDSDLVRFLLRSIVIQQQLTAR